jgi:hypothetical protein
MMLAPVRALAVLLFLGAGSALAQDAQNRAASTVDTTPPGTLDTVTLPPLANPDAPNIPAKELFARKLTPLAGPARAIGGYAKGCMAGAEELPITGPTWQVMRLSRNRNWGNPVLIEFIKRFGDNAKKVGWNGLLIGDMAQPRGGPMLSGHASHQIGLDADIWFSAMPDHVLSREEREMTGAVNMVAPSGLDAGPHRAGEGRRRGSRDRAHFRQRGDQEGNVQRGRFESRLAGQSAAVVGACRALPRSAQLPAGQPAMRVAATGAARRRLRPCAGLLVHRRRTASEAAGKAARTADRTDARRVAGGLQAGREGAVGLWFEHDLFRKPVSTLGSSPRAGFFGITL